jgi:hypothetical protein
MIYDLRVIEYLQPLSKISALGYWDWSAQELVNPKSYFVNDFGFLIYELRFTSRGVPLTILRNISPWVIRHGVPTMS